MRTASSSSRHGGGGVSTPPGAETPLPDQGSPPDRSPSTSPLAVGLDHMIPPLTSPLAVGLDQIPLNFPLGCGRGNPPWRPAARHAGIPPAMHAGIAPPGQNDRHV